MFLEYGPLSTKVYEFTKPVGTSIGGDIFYYSEQLKSVKGKILEAGVGTGRMLIPLLELGLDVDGVDASRAMLDQCESNLRQYGKTATLYNQDLTDLRLPTKYEAIIMPTGSFGLIKRSQALLTLQHFYNHLMDKGTLYIDLEMPSDFIPNTLSSQVFQFDEQFGIIYECFNETLDWEQQRTSTISKYQAVYKGAISETEVSHFLLHWYGIEEFCYMLKDVGFREITILKDYNQSNEGIFTFVAKK